MRVLGIDYGEKKIGLAIADGPLAEPLGVINKKSWESRIGMVCEKQGIEKIIVGVSEGKMANKTKKFGEMLGKITGLPVEYHDETLTTKEAIAKMEEIGKRLKAEDAISAALILQEYLDKLERK